MRHFGWRGKVALAMPRRPYRGLHYLAGSWKLVLEPPTGRISKRVNRFKEGCSL
jgi:hypothetical protein